MTEPQRRHQMLSLEQAVGAAPTLAALQERIRESSHCLTLVQHLLPAPLRRSVAAGPIQDNEWCLLVPSAAASAKLRQLLPLLLKQLNQNGAQITVIRVKVQADKR